MAFQEFSKNCWSILMVLSTLSILPSSSVWPAIFVLQLNESVALAPLKSTILPSLFTAGISLKYCYKLPDVFE